MILLISNKSLTTNCHFAPKALNLIKLRQYGYQVPEGFLLSVEFVDNFINVSELENVFQDLHKRHKEGHNDLDKYLLSKIINRDISEALINSIQNKIRSSFNHNTDNVFVVRSAAMEEDSDQYSCAGQYLTCLHVQQDDIPKKLIECYCSWWTDSAISYRNYAHLNFVKPRMSMIIQRQLIPAYSGVCFSNYPGSNNVIVEAIQGLGSPLMSGLKTPSYWEYDSNQKCIRRILKDECQGLDSEIILQIYRSAKHLENEIGQPVIIEWAIENSQLFLLQLRYVTKNSTLNNSYDNSIYTRSMVEDLWPDRMSNMTSSIFFNKILVKDPLQLFSISSYHPVKVLNGYAYINLEIIEKLLPYIPKLLLFKEISNAFPVGYQTSIQNQFKFRKLWKILLRSPFLLKHAYLIRVSSIHYLKKHLHKNIKKLDTMNVDYYHNNELDFYDRELNRILDIVYAMQQNNQWGYGKAAIYTWCYRHIASKYASKSEEWILNSLTGLPQNINDDIRNSLQSLIHCIDEDLLNTIKRIDNYKQAINIINKKYRTKCFTIQFNQLIKKYKYRYANRDILFPRWDENPDFVLEMLVNQDFTPDNNDTNHRKNNQKFSKTVMGLFLYRLCQLTKKYLSLREDLRSGLDIAFYRLRKLLLSINQHDYFSSFHCIENSIFFLEIDELQSLLRRERNSEEFVEIIRERKQLFEKNCQISPPYHVRVVNNDIIVMPQRTDSNQDRITGVGAASGISEGICRKITNKSDFSKIKKGDIIIAYNADPGMTPLFRIASGIAVEIGGILNHCSIVAREYGIPTVVGAVGIMKKINDGQQVRINGDIGFVEVLGNSNESR